MEEIFMPPGSEGFETEVKIKMIEIPLNYRGYGVINDNFFRELAKTENLEIFESKAIQAVIT
jgi:hypothetical protein